MQHANKLSNIKTGFSVAAAIAISVSIMAAATPVGATGSSQHNVSDKHAVMQSQHTKESQAARDLRRGLRTLLREHVTTNIAVNRLIASGASQAKIDAGIQAQVANSDALSAAIGSIYGAEAEAEFSEMFLEHIEESNNFAIAVAAGDESAKAEAIVEMNEYLDEIATFLSTNIPVLPYDAVYGLLLEHENLINRSTEAFLTENFGQSKKFEIKARKQVTVIADALASGIIATQPDKF